MIRILKHTAYMVFAAILPLACSKEEVPEREQCAISFNINTSQYTSKATFFDGNNYLIDKTKGGGDFRLNAYINGSEEVVIDHARVNYINSSWRFRDEMGTPNNDLDDVLINYYWPFDTNLDFYAYMPMNLTNTGVTLGTYSATTGPVFSCVLPLTKSDQMNYQEFIYAYTTDKSAKDQLGSVNLNFQHPFACVKFMMGDSYRIKIHSVKLTNIYYQGNYSNLQWSNQGAPGTLDIEVEQFVPEDINNSLIGGPYVVLPQSFTNDDTKLILELTRTGETTPVAPSMPLRILSEKWEPGKIYTYTLKFGDSGEEVIFDVKVEEWSVVEYKDEIYVE